MPIIKQTLEECNLNLNDIDLLVCDVGPGSFTGIRIGISTIKAFVDSLNIKAVGINSFEALSQNLKNDSIICSLIDAKKDNVYNEIFENINGNYIIRRKASFENIDTLLSELKSIEPTYNLTFVGDGSIKYKDKILEYFPNSKFSLENNLSAKNVGIAGFNSYRNPTPAPLEPLYLRKSEAEQKLEEKQNGLK
jgi:tRNA threonylcarbamoyladenosine biosynthesis protein TsaB